MKLFVFYLCCLPSVIQSCILLLNGWVPASLEKRTELATVVVSGYVKTAFKERRTRAQTYKVEFKVNTVLKGREKLRRVRHSDNVYNISNFGDKKNCYADLDRGRSYILFLTTYKGRLSAKYDDIFGAAARYSKESEEQILASLGWLPWSDWSPCSRTCSSGVQTRTRVCNSTCTGQETTHECQDVCPGETSETRYCNMFTCQDSRNILDLLPAWRLPTGATRLPNGTLRLNRTVGIHFRTWRLQPVLFSPPLSLMLSVKPAPLESGYLLSLADFSGSVKIALELDESSVQFHYEDAAAEMQTLTFDASLEPGQWHRLALSFAGDELKFYYDCQSEGSMRLPSSGRAWSEETVTSIGLPFGRKNQRLSSFQGLVSELYISNDPTAARKQCADYTIPMNEQGDVERLNNAILATNSPGPARPSQIRGGRQIDDEHKTNDVSNGNDVIRPDEGTSSLRLSAEPVWTSWSLCSEACGGGTQTRKRECPTQERNCALFDGAAHLETRYCNLKKCPVECKTPCLNGGTCVATDKCDCVRGYDGHRCQTAVCESGCENGGRCVAPNTCSCPAGFSGPTCNQGSCSLPCEQGGVCTEDGQRCSCRAGTHGRYCQYFHCDPPCRNGGRCVAPNHCQCPFGTSGAQCQTAANRCRYCLNGGRCSHDNRCKCGNGYYGNRCERRQCSYQPVVRTYITGQKRLEPYQVAVRCNQWSWKICMEERVRYRIIYRIAQRTEYVKVCS